MYIKKYFLILSSFCILSSLAMQNALNETLKKALIITQKNYDVSFDEQNLDEIISLIEQRADINLQVKQKTSLMLAIQLQNSNFVKYLLEHGANPNICYKKGYNSLHIALEQLSMNPNKFDMQIVTDLLMSKANINAEIIDGKKTPLLMALTIGNLDLIKYLIEHNADVNQPNHFSTPLAQSISNKNCSATKELCIHRASLINLDKHKNTVFHYLVGRKKECIETVIIHASFNNQKQHQKLQKIKDKLKTIFIILQRYNIPKDLLYLIASKLPENPFWGINIKFSLDKGFKHFHTINYVKNHLQQIKKILKISNKNFITPLRLLCSTYIYDPKYINEVKDLFKGTILEKDFDALKEYPNVSQTNLALQIYNNYNNSLWKTDSIQAQEPNSTFKN